MFTNKNRTEQEKLLHQILNNSYKVKGNNVKFLIDSSKDPINLAYLLSIKDINLKVIFLTRDLNAVINSCQKINQPWLKTIFFWIITNILSKLVLLNVKKENKVNLSYDNFVKRLPFYINQLNSKLNLKIDYKNLILNINNEIFHNFAGIILRIKPLTYISYDDSWKFVNTNWKKKYILFITRFFNNLWVYKRVFLMSQF